MIYKINCNRKIRKNVAPLKKFFEQANVFKMTNFQLIGPITPGGYLIITTFFKEVNPFDIYGKPYSRNEPLAEDNRVESSRCCQCRGSAGSRNTC